jgi:hypothetical protein
MTQDLLERLERSNPVPDDPGAPPIETVLARIEASSRRPLWNPPAWRSALLPVLGATAALGVVVVALLLAGHGPPPSPPASPVSAGLPGVVFASGAYLDPGHEIVSVAQCSPCQTSGPGQVEHYWTLVSRDGGDSWRTAKTPPGTDVGGVEQFNTAAAAFDHHSDVWAIGSHRTHSGGLAFDALVSPDGGLRWSRARVPVPGYVGGVSVAGGETWATSGGYCQGTRCVAAQVLRGPSSGSILESVSAAPWPASSALQVVAGDAHTAYVTVTAGRQPRRTLVTHNGGRSWTQLGSPCMTTAADGVLRSTGPDVIWELCPLPGGAGSEIDSSANGGEFWHRGYAPRRWGGVKDLEPTSSREAWLVTDGGIVAVTGDRGLTWRKVWSAGDYHPRAHLPIVSPQPHGGASVFATQTSGGLTRVVEYRAHAAGGPWTARFVPVASQR